MTNRVFIDTEFLNRGAGSPINLISIGMVRANGDEFYGVNVDAPLADMAVNRWIRRVLWRTLPLESINSYGILDWAKDHPDIEHVKKLDSLREEVYQFLIADGPVELWGSNSGFDYVVLSQLFGSFDDSREGIPWYINDLQQELWRPGMEETLANTILGAPLQEGVRHHALHDARHVKATYDWLQGVLNMT